MMCEVPESQAQRDQSVWEVTSEVDYMDKSGRAEHPSHAAVLELLRQRFRDQHFSLLDCGVMSGVMFRDLEGMGLDFEYTGLDISPAVIEDCRARYSNAEWLHMPVGDIKFRADSFDVVHARHLLEHLPYYETAVREMFRVAREAVVICFFQAPKEPELLHRRDALNGYLWLNRYAPGPFESLLASLSTTVESVQVVHEHLTHRIYHCSLT